MEKAISQLSLEKNGKKIAKPENQYFEEYLTAFGDVLKNKEVVESKELAGRISEFFAPMLRRAGFKNLQVTTKDGQGLYNDVYGFKSKTIENVINISRGDVVEPHEIVSFLQDKNFKIHKLKNKFDVFEKKNIRMTLDYEEDFQFFKTIIENLQEDYTFEDILNYIDNNKSIKDINYFREVDWKNNQ